MALEVQHIFLDGLNCYEKSILSVISWLGYDYELAFSESWGFKLDYHQELWGYKIDPDSHFCDELLESYHGISLSIGNQIPINEFLELVENELMKNLPVVILHDPFWCPWDKFYQKRHSSGHAFIVNGIEKGTLDIECSDPWYDKHNLRLCRNDIKNGLLRYITFHPLDSKPKEFDWKQMLLQAVRKLEIWDERVDSFDSIRLFGQQLGIGLDLRLEFGDQVDNIWYSPLYSKINMLRNNRYKFSKALQFLARVYHQPELEDLSSQFNICASKWLIINQMLAKAYVLQNVYRGFDKISKRIMDIADMEELFAKRLYNLAHEDSKESLACSLYKNNDVLKSNIDSIHPLLYMVDLKQYLNNNGLDTNIEINSLANFTGNGKYLFIEDGSMLRTIKVENMQFRFPQVDYGVKDNISCEGQEILLYIGACESIMLLGCCEYGNFTDYFNISYHDGDDEKILVSLTDSWECNPKFGEAVALRVREVEKRGVEVIAKEEVHGIYACEYRLCKKKRLKSIHLPDCPNMHLFAITLQGCVIANNNYEQQ